MKRFPAGVVAALVLLVVSALPAGAVGPNDFTGDIRGPELVSMTASATSADVTAAAATLTFELRVTDDLSGLENLMLLANGPDGTGSYGMGLIRVSGDANDGRWRGEFTLPRWSRPGRWPLHVSTTDRVGNGHNYDSDALAAAGFPSALTVVNRDPDTEAGSITEVTVNPTTVNTNGGAAPVYLRMRATDRQSGIKWLAVFLLSPADTAGGVSQQPHMQRVQGTANDGYWEGYAYLPRYTRQGRWRLIVRTFDQVDNNREYDTAELEAAGLPTGFDVVSYEDAEAPRIEMVSVSPVEVNVHDADQPVKVRLRATDNLSGIKDSYGALGIHIGATDPVTQQSSWPNELRRVSGDHLDGVYEMDVVVRKSSSTGLRPIHAGVTDAIDNWRSYSPSDIVALGGPPALLVYNTPLPPDLLGVDPGDGSVLVRWAPPADDRGAEVTGYVVVESPGGRVTELAADARSVVVTGLSNGVEHTFTVKAVNKAGPSDPSRAATAVPQAGAGAPGSGPDSGTGIGTGSGTSLVPSKPAGSGYWMLGAGGAVYSFGDAANYGAVTPTRPGTAVDIEPTPTRGGYWAVDAAGRVTAAGQARHLGDRPLLLPGETVTSLSATPSGNGYWLFTTKGRVTTYGDAGFFGDLRSMVLNQPVIDSVPTPGGRGYFMVAADGGVFTFGDARFVGSTGHMKLNRPVQSLVPDPDGHGYWLVAADGGIFAFNAPFHGSMGGTRLARPVTGMVGSRTGHGYLMVAEDGGIFAFGDVPFHGSLGATPPAVPIVAVAAY